MVQDQWFVVVVFDKKEFYAFRVRRKKNYVNRCLGFFASTKINHSEEGLEMFDVVPMFLKPLSVPKLMGGSELLKRRLSFVNFFCKFSLPSRYKFECELLMFSITVAFQMLHSRLHVSIEVFIWSQFMSYCLLTDF